MNTARRVALAPLLSAALLAVGPGSGVSTATAQATPAQTPAAAPVAPPSNTPPATDAPGAPAATPEPLDPAPGTPSPAAQMPAAQDTESPPASATAQPPGAAEAPAVAPAPPPTTTPAVAPDAAPTAAPPPTTAAPAEPTAPPPAPQAEAPPAPAPADPVVAVVRERLADRQFGGAAVQSDRDGAIAFYGERTDAPLWVKSGGGFSPAAEAAIAEVRKAEEWGLSLSAFAIPQASAETSPQALADNEAAVSFMVLQYVRQARGGRTDPRAISPALDLSPPLKDPKTVLQEIAKAGDAAAYLRDQHPKHEQFVRLRDALARMRGPVEPAPAVDEALSVKIPPGKIIRPGQEHADVSLLRRRLKVPAEAGNENKYDQPLEEAVLAFQRANGVKANGLVGKATRAALNGDTQEAKPNPQRDIQRIVNNMERWRWMPENLGQFHIWNNVPEFKTRAIKDGKQVYEERIVVGLPQWATPSFSAQMKTIVFHPEWGVPDGIKQKELAPQLRRSSGGGMGIFEDLFGGGGSGSSSAVLRRHDLRVSYNGRPVDPDSVDWNSVDIRRFQFTQPSGSKNVLGIVKFLFPNKHDVYMHDTTAKHLFKQNMRAYSHGCMRVANPIQFAELLLQEDKGWTPAQVEDRFNMGGLNEVKIDKPIWVHSTYFTAYVDDAGKLNTFADVYGFEPRVTAALTGKSMTFEAVPQIAEVAPGEDGAPPPTQRRRKQRVTQSDPLTEAIQGLFAN
jgi:murein L,D-transpeptidase YcbB/YkuD